MKIDSILFVYINRIDIHGLISTFLVVKVLMIIVV